MLELLGTGTTYHNHHRTHMTHILYRATMDNDVLFPVYATDDEEAAYKSQEIAKIYYGRKLKDVIRIKEKL